MLDVRFLAASFFAGSLAAGFAGSSSGKDRSRLSPEASCLSEDAGAEGEGEEEDAGGALGAGFCCAHTALPNTSNQHK
jgi:hypothetical protein